MALLIRNRSKPNTPARIAASTGEKKIKGRNRHIAVDILGNLLCVMVHAANLSDTKEGCTVAKRAVEKFPSLQAFSADEGYRGTFVDYVAQALKRVAHISKKIKDAWAILPKRWIVERTFSWFGHSRRLAKDYEILPETEENFCRIAMIALQLRRLA